MDQLTRIADGEYFVRLRGAESHHLVLSGWTPLTIWLGTPRICTEFLNLFLLSIWSKSRKLRSYERKLNEFGNHFWSLSMVGACDCSALFHTSTITLLSVFSLKLDDAPVAAFPLCRESWPTLDSIRRSEFRLIPSPATFLLLAPSTFGEFLSKSPRESSRRGAASAITGNE